MKQSKIFFLALSGALIAPHEAQSKACVNPVSVVCPQISCSANVVHISQADVGSAGYSLDIPGTRYCLVESITWTPTISGTPTAPVSAFQITASNIEFDLNGYTIQQSGTANFAVGINITNGGFAPGKPNLNNIIVKNGTVQNFATAGIYVDPIDELLFEDLYVVKNGYSGYILCPCTAHRVGGIIYPSYLPNDLPPGPNQFQNNHIFRNVHADFNGGSLDTDAIWTHGMNIANVNSVLIQNCSFNNNFNNNPSPLGFALLLSFGLNIFNTANVLVQNSQFNENTANAAFVVVAGLDTQDGGSNITVQNCTFDSNRSNQSDCKALACGIPSMLIESCTFNNNISTVGNCYGAYLSVNYADVINCQANFNQAE